MKYNVYRSGGVLLTPTPVTGPPFVDLSLSANTDYNYYVTAVADDGTESLPSIVVGAHTDSTTLPGGGSAVQHLFSYNFPSAPNTTPSSLFGSYVLKSMTGTGTFTSTAGSWFVQNGVAQPGTVATNGYYYLLAPYFQDQGTRDHSSEVTAVQGASFQTSGDRSLMPVVRGDGTGDNWVGAVSHWATTDSCQILTCINRVITVRAAGSATSISDYDRFKLVADGNRYTALKTSGTDGSVVTMCEWIDDQTLYPFPYRRTGFGFQYVRSSGSIYFPPGQSYWWRGEDLRASTNTDYLNAFALTLAGIETWPALTGPATKARGIAVCHTQDEEIL